MIPLYTCLDGLPWMKRKNAGFRSLSVAAEQNKLYLS